MKVRFPFVAPNYFLNGTFLFNRCFLFVVVAAVVVYALTTSSIAKVDRSRLSSFDSSFQTFVLSHSTTMQYRRSLTMVADRRNKSSIDSK